MRTTLTLDPDVAEQLERAARGSGKGIKATVNEALRIGLGMANKPVEPPKFRIGAFVNSLQPGIDADKMNQLLDQLEAEHFAHKHPQ
ncbi:MAG TPA: CopG family transcriptional regulator [Thermoanaerobaculia bacterium]